MLGVVVGRGVRRERYALRTDEGYVVIDLDGEVLDLGERLVGDMRVHGDITLHREESGAPVPARVEAFDASRDAAESLLR